MALPVHTVLVKPEVRIITISDPELVLVAKVGPARALALGELDHGNRAYDELRHYLNQFEQEVALLTDVTQGLLEVLDRYQVRTLYVFSPDPLSKAETEELGLFGFERVEDFDGFLMRSVRTVKASDGLPVAFGARSEPSIGSFPGMLFVFNGPIFQLRVAARHDELQKERNHARAKSREVCAEIGVDPESFDGISEALGKPELKEKVRTAYALRQAIYDIGQKLRYLEPIYRNRDGFPGKVSLTYQEIEALGL